MVFKIETVTSSKLKGAKWDDIDQGDIAMIFISYGRIISHLQFLYIKDGNFSLSERHGDLVEHLEIHNILEIGAPVYELPAYYAGTPTPEKFQHNILEIGAPVYELPTYYVEPVYYTGTPLYYVGSPIYYTGIKLDYPSEFLIGVNGRHGVIGTERYLKSITFVTNKNSYGPFPKNRPTYMGSEDTEFNINVGNYGWLNGFHGTICNGQLESFGVYINPIPISKDIDYDKIDVIDC